jgi:hypothetical protein
MMEMRSSSTGFETLPERMTAPTGPESKTDVHHAQRVARNLLPLSLEKNDLATALREWEYARRSKEVDDEACDLCEHKALHYKFLIINRKTQAILWVGSMCITKFDIATFHEGRRLSDEEAVRAISNDRRSAIEDARKARAIDALVQVATRLERAKSKEGDPRGFLFRSFLESYREQSHLSPKQLNVVFWQAKEHGLLGTEIDPADFRVGLKSKTDQNGMRSLKPFQRLQISPALRPDQRAWCESHLGRNWNRG